MPITRRCHLVKDKPAKMTWDERRRLYITSSEVAAAMGKDPYRSTAQLFMDKCHGKKFVENAAMILGREEEPKILTCLSETLMAPKLSLSTAFGKFASLTNAEYPWMATQPDAFIRLQGKTLPVEVKCRSEEYHIEAIDKTVKLKMWSPIPPAHYRLQLQYHMLVTGAEEGVFAAWVVPLRELCYWRFKANKKLHSQIIERTKQVWDCLQTRVLTADLNNGEEIHAI